MIWLILPLQPNNLMWIFYNLDIMPTCSSGLGRTHKYKEIADK